MPKNTMLKITKNILLCATNQLYVKSLLKKEGATGVVL